MGLLFLIGLLAAIETMVIITVALMGGKWLKEYVAKKLKNKKNQKVAFADTREVVDDYLKNKADASDELSMEELERMCEKTPYVSALVDENGEIGEYEGIYAEGCNENFEVRIKQQKGMIVVGV
ncbi:MAG: hypothetical protein K6G76_03280 [Lachnospiraceae bacterium]|nr:hypothetical protein [Lachnospiraceae bacterium]